MAEASMKHCSKRLVKDERCTVLSLLDSGYMGIAEVPYDKLIFCLNIAQPFAYYIIG